AGRVLRLAPVFAESSRQARVEVEVPNPSRRLKPGMFVRVDVVLDEAAAATIVPLAALVRRAGRDGVFLVPAREEHVAQVRFVPVRTGIVAGERVQVDALDATTLEGLVVTLGQQLIEHGSRVRVVQGDGSVRGDPLVAGSSSDGASAGNGAADAARATGDQPSDRVTDRVTDRAGNEPESEP